jgi:hypothetical protein
MLMQGWQRCSELDSPRTRNTQPSTGAPAAWPVQHMDGGRGGQGGGHTRIGAIATPDGTTLLPTGAM